MAEWNDPFTRWHVKRVSRYTEWIARQLADSETWNENEILSLGLAALVHDVGKVAMPGGMLFKPAQLSKGERMHIEEHTEIGAEIIGYMQELFQREFALLHDQEQHRPELWMGLDQELEHSVFLLAKEIAWSHHEQWDEEGYPRGLRGEDIPISARIVSLADVIDALMMVRPYKSGWTKAEVYDYLKLQQGHQFDPRITQAVLDHWADFPFETESDGFEPRILESRGGK